MNELDKDEYIRMTALQEANKTLAVAGFNSSPDMIIRAARDYEKYIRKGTE